MPKKVFVLVGTNKGVFILEGTAERSAWELRGPFCDVWPIHHVVADTDDGTIYAGGGNRWLGVAVWKSTDLGKTWTRSGDGLAYEADEEPVKSVWSGATAAGILYAGVEPAGLFLFQHPGQALESDELVGQLVAERLLEAGQERVGLPVPCKRVMGFHAFTCG